MSNGMKPAFTTGEPGLNRKSLFAASTKSGSTTSPFVSFPFACHCANVLPLNDGAPFSVHQKLPAQFILPFSRTDAPYRDNADPAFQ